jgi:hypothetical protein
MNDPARSQQRQGTSNSCTIHCGSQLLALRPQSLGGGCPFLAGHSVRTLQAWCAEIRDKQLTDSYKPDYIVTFCREGAHEIVKPVWTELVSPNCERLNVEATTALSPKA